MARILLLLIAIPLSCLFYFIRNTHFRENLNYSNLPQHEALKTEDLLYSNQYLNEPGWSKTPIKPFTSTQLGFFQRLLRLKKWDQYQFTTTNFYLNIRFIDLSYIQQIEIDFLDFEDDHLINKQYFLIPFFDTWFVLSDDLFVAENQVINFINSEIKLHFEAYNEEIQTEVRQIQLTMTTQELSLSANLKFESTIGEERLVVSTPINSKRDQWSYAQKVYNWGSNGTVNFQNKTYEVEENSSNVAYKWERGVWNYRTFWLWCSGQGFTVSGKRFGLNLGGGFQDSKEGVATEDALYIDQRVYKLKNLEYSYNLNSANETIVIKTLKIRKDQRSRKFNFYCEFTPKKMIRQETEMGIFQLHIQRYYGEFFGFYIEGDGTVLEFHRIFGIIEINKSTW